MTTTTVTPKILFVGNTRICPQIAYVLDIQDYDFAEKLTKQNIDQYRDYQIYVCAFKGKSGKLVERKLRTTVTNIQYLDDICRKIDEAYYANRERHKNDFDNVKKIPVTKESTKHPSLFRRIIRGMKHPLRAAWHVVLRVKNHVKATNFKHKIEHFKFRNQTQLKKYLRYLKPSQLLLKVLYAKPNLQIQCTRLETDLHVISSNEINGCCSVTVPFGNLLLDGELDEIYHSTYARIVKLSSLNHSYCFCQLNRWCKGYCEKNQSLSPMQWQTPIIPNRINLSFDRSCNLCCKSCRAKPIIKDDEKRIKPIVEKILRSGWLEKVEHLRIAGNGEVFHSPYYRQLLMTDLQRQQVIIFSNGTLFNKDNWQLVFGKYRIIDVSISVDATTTETYQKLRGGNFNNLMNNLTMLSDLHRKKQIHRFTLNFVVQRDNFREMPAFVKLGQALGVDQIQFQRLNDCGKGTFTPKTLLENCLIINDQYMNYDLWCVLQDPIFNDPIVDLKGLQKYIDASEKRYRQCYEREQKQK